MTRLKLPLSLTCLIALVLVSLAFARVQPPSGQGGHHAVTGIGTVAKASLQGVDPKLVGTASFTQLAGGVHVVADFSGAAAGKHALQVREKGLCGAPFASAGDLLNTYHLAHGCPPDPIRELGNLGNVEIKADGTGHFDQVIDKISVVDPHHLIVGRSIVLLAGDDNCKTEPAGSSGRPVARRGIHQS